MPEFEITKKTTIDVSWDDISRLEAQGVDPADYALDVAHTVDDWEITVHRYEDE